MKKKRLISALCEVLYYLIFIAFLFALKSSNSPNVPYDFTICLAMALFMVALLLLTGSHLNKYLGFLLGGIYALYLITQKIYYRGFGSYYRFSTALELSKEVAEQGAAISELTNFNDWLPLVFLTIITLVFLLLRYVFKLKVQYRWYLRLSALAPIVIAGLLVNGVVSTILASNNDDNWQIYQTDFYLYDTVNNPKTFVDKFGLLTYAYRDAQTLLSQGIDKADYGSLIDEYFATKDGSSEANEYTGLFKDKSLLLIQAESLMNLGIDEELTPTLCRLTNSGLVVKGFDTPLLIGSTSDSEYMTNTSFIPESDGYSVCYKYVNNTLPLTLGNLFKEQGYKTNAFHNNYAEYYNRNITLANYGYDFMDSYLLGLESESPDSAIAEQIGWIDVEREKFMSFWISYSGHQPYEDGAVGISEANVARVRAKYPILADSYVYYLAKTMDFDQALESFLNVMEWMGRLDDVAIIIYGDHSAKGLDFAKGSAYDEALGVNAEDEPAITYTPLLIWANALEATTIDKYCTCLDLLPTIANLWGFEYDHKLVFGEDILDSDYAGWCFDANGNYWSADFRYDALTGKVEVMAGASETKALELVAAFDHKRDICNKILKIDYFKK